MSDRAPEGSISSSLRIGMYPLMITSGSSELIDLFLGDCVPVAVAQMRADRSMQLLDGPGTHVGILSRRRNHAKPCCIPRRGSRCAAPIASRVDGVGIQRNCFGDSA